jgi:hypothetical protein
LGVPLLRRHHPSPSKDYVGVPYRDQRPCLRLDFAFRCVYCLAHETEVGPQADYGGFEIEHFKPKRPFRHLKDRTSNLLWACRACNLVKRNKWPTDELSAAGFRFVDPATECLGKHLELVGDEEVRALTKAGQYMIAQVQLNSDLHRKRRRDRNGLLKRHTLLQATVEVLEEELAALGSGTSEAIEIAKELGASKRELELLKVEILPGPPWDAPSVCRCSGPAVPVHRYPDPI